MPELPEVEAARRLLDRGCTGKRIEKAVVANDEKVFEGATPEAVQRALEGRRVVRTRRKGKYLWLELDNAEGPWPLLHFGMTGGIVVQKMGVSKYKRIHLESDPDEWPPRFTKLELDLEGGAKLAFVDARRFARVKLLRDPPSQEPLSRLGFDVMDELPPPAEFAAAVRKRVARAPALKIKALLLDQVLYQARIHPEQSAASLDDSALAALHGAIRSVIDIAVEAEADSDKFPRDWLFHYRWTNKKPSSINGHKIEFVTVGSRTSAFVPALQKLTGNGGGSSGEGGGGKGRTRASAKAGGASRKRGRGSAKKASESDEEQEEEEEEQDIEEETTAPAKRSRAAGGRKAAAAAAVTKKARGGGQSKQGRKRKGNSSEEEEDQASSEDASEQEEEQEDDGDDSEEEEEALPKKRSRSKRPAAAPAKKSVAATKRQGAARGRKAKA